MASSSTMRASRIVRDVTMSEEQFYAVGRAAQRSRDPDEKRLLKAIADFWFNNEATEMELEEPLA